MKKNEIIQDISRQEVFLRKLQSQHEVLLSLCEELGIFGQAFLKEQRKFNCKLKVDFSGKDYSYKAAYEAFREGQYIHAITFYSDECTDDEIIYILFHEYIHVFQAQKSAAAHTRSGMLPMSPIDHLKIVFIEEIDANSKSLLFDYFLYLYREGNFSKDYDNIEYISHALEYYARGYLYSKNEQDQNLGKSVREIYINNVLTFYENNLDLIMADMKAANIPFITFSDYDLWNVCNNMSFNGIGNSPNNYNIMQKLVMLEKDWGRLNNINKKINVNENNTILLSDFLESINITVHDYLNEKKFFW